MSFDDTAEDRARAQMLTAIDLVDAIDLDQWDEDRIAAVERMLERDPAMACTTAVSVLHGVIQELDRLAPGRGRLAIRTLRANIAATDFR